MNVYQVQVYKSFNGRGGTESQWTNKYNFTSADEITGASITAAVTRIVAWEKSFHSNIVHFMRAVVTLVGDDDGPAPKGIVRVIDQVGTGALAIAYGNIEPLNMVLNIRFQTGNTKGKSNSYRGALDEAAINPDSSGKPGLSHDQGSHPLYGAAGQATLIGAGGPTPLVVISKKKADPAPTVNGVTSIGVQGAGFRDRRVRRKPKNVTDDGSFVDTMIEVAKVLGPALIFLLTKGKSLTPAQRLPLMAASATVGDVIGSIQDFLTPDAPAV